MHIILYERCTVTRKKIDHPKVFISYAWGDEEYQNLVLSFATQLMGDGVSVVFDKWDLTEGNDTNAFMEKCVNDPSITNVLMLLDPLYAVKANEHSGGVGTETQIISSQVYSRVEQDRFIPVVMKRGIDGSICKPTYLQGRLHFDLSLPEKYDEEYQRLVKRLYGEEVYPKPELGAKPAWVERAITVSAKTVVTYDVLKNPQPDTMKRAAFIAFLREISNDIIAINYHIKSGTTNPIEYISQYDDTAAIRARFLQLLRNSGYVQHNHHLIGDFLEETANGVSHSSGCSDIARTRLHELFLYVIAFFLKNKDYPAIGYLLGRTYFSDHHYSDHGVGNFKMLYSGIDHEGLDLAIQKRDNKRYYTGTGEHWIETLATEFCSKEQFILADLVCFNYSIYGIGSFNNEIWFPITYIYDNEYNSALKSFSKKLISLEYAQDVLPLFGFTTIEELKTKMKSVEDNPSLRREIRYSEAFENAPIISYFIKSVDVGSRR